MSIAEDLEKIEDSVEGLIRYSRSLPYLPSKLSFETDRLLSICKELNKKIENIELDLKKAKEQACIDGFEEGKKLGLLKFENMLKDLDRFYNKKSEQRLREANDLINTFVSNLSRKISRENVSFVKEYIGLLSESLKGLSARVIVSQEIFDKLQNQNLKMISIVPDPQISPEQIFIEEDHNMIDASIDRFFEEMLR